MSDKLTKLIKQANEKHEKVQDIEYLVNPTKTEMKGFMSRAGELRGVLSNVEDVYLWKASSATHTEFQDRLGIKGHFFVLGDNFISGKTKDITMFLVTSSRLKELGPFRIMSRFF